MGLWVGCRNLGNIIGYVLCLVITQHLRFKWEVNFYFASALGIAMAICVYVFLSERPL